MPHHTDSTFGAPAEGYLDSNNALWEFPCCLPFPNDFSNRSGIRSKCYLELNALCKELLCAINLDLLGLSHIICVLVCLQETDASLKVKKEQQNPPCYWRTVHWRRGSRCCGRYLVLLAAKSLPALFQDAVSAATDEERLVKIHDVIQQLPPPHYRLVAQPVLCL